jgi:hypothetical protein
MNKQATFKKGDSVFIMENGWNELFCILVENFDKYGFALAKGHSVTFGSKTSYFMVNKDDIGGRLKFPYEANK